MRVSELLQEKSQSQRKQEAQTIHDQFFTRPVVAAEFARWVKSHPFVSKMDRIIDRWFPSSKTCNSCGAIKTELSLNERIYECEHCGAIEDRDLNAAKNILSVGLAT